jgi:hypothetical protein
LGFLSKNLERIKNEKNTILVLKTIAFKAYYYTIFAPAEEVKV